jgi:hypothetical protein
VTQVKYGGTIGQSSLLNHQSVSSFQCVGPTKTGKNVRSFWLCFCFVRALRLHWKMGGGGLLCFLFVLPCDLTRARAFQRAHHQPFSPTSRAQTPRAFPQNHPHTQLLASCKSNIKPGWVSSSNGKKCIKKYTDTWAIGDSVKMQSANCADVKVAAPRNGH